jgi:hypothetical protein
MMKTMRETTSVIALGSATATDERDAVNSRRFRAALRTSVCWPGLKRSRISPGGRGRRPVRGAPRGPARSPRGKGQKPGGVSWRPDRHRTGSDAGWPAGTGTSQPCRGPARGLAVGDEPDADQRLDPAVPALGSPARWRCRLGEGRRHLQVSGVAQVRRAVERETEGLAGLSSLDLLAIQICTSRRT